MIFGRVNASARKIVVRVLAPDLGERPLPEAERLGVRVVDAEDRDAARDPELDTRASARARAPASRPISKSNG